MLWHESDNETKGEIVRIFEVAFFLQHNSH